MKKNTDWLDKLASEALVRVESGYYQIKDTRVGADKSMAESIMRNSNNSVIAEIKPKSPSMNDPIGSEVKMEEYVKMFEEGEAVGISVLTEPKFFNGSLDNLFRASLSNLPTLMKDFVVDESQLRACASLGGKAVLFIQTLFDRGYVKFDLSDGISKAHDLGLEVLLETSAVEEYKRAIDTDADMIGINNRNLADLKVDLSRTGKIIDSAVTNKPVWSLSGISSPEDVVQLRGWGADAFLVGTSLMNSNQPKKTLKRLVYAR